MKYCAVPRTTSVVASHSVSRLSLLLFLRLALLLKQPLQDWRYISIAFKVSLVTNAIWLCTNVLPHLSETVIASSLCGILLCGNPSCLGLCYYHTAVSGHQRVVHREGFSQGIWIAQPMCVSALEARHSRCEIMMEKSASGTTQVGKGI